MSNLKKGMMTREDNENEQEDGQKRQKKCKNAKKLLAKDGTI